MTLADAVALARPTRFFRGTVHIIRGKKTLIYDFNQKAAKKIRLLRKDIVELAK